MNMQIAATPTTRVFIKTQAYDVYMGRAMPGLRASKFANPYRIGVDGTREQVIERYRAYLDDLLGRNSTAREEFESLRGKRLACWCRDNQDCHVDVVIAKLEGREWRPREAAQIGMFDELAM